MNNVRKAERKDIPRLLELLIQVNMVHHNGRPDLFKGPATKYGKAELETILADNSTPVFVCTDENGYIQGYVFCIIKQITGDKLMADIKTLYIDDLCVDETVRGRHIGKTLYDFVMHYAKEIGCYNLTLNVWALNGDAIKFYEKCGLKPQKIGMETIL